MFPNTLLKIVTALLVSAAALTSSLFAEEVPSKFYKAYYLDQALGDKAAAADLYADVVHSSGVSAEIRQQAEARLAACREDLVASDFARLMPPNPLAYVEVNRPGERISKLLDKLGLLADANKLPAPGETRVAIHPALVEALLGMRGLAVAVTGFDPAQQRPSGVAVLHPGDMSLVRGAIESALPAAARPMGAIQGYPTYNIENEVIVTLTSRLVIISNEESQIEGVLYRMKNAGEDSLANNQALAEVRADRGDALAFFFVNPQPIMPLLQGAMAAAAAQDREAALAITLLDPRSVHSLAGTFDISDEGLLAEVTLRLDEGHRNLVFNFLRGPAIDPATLRCVPSNAAAFFALALNEAPDKYAKQTAGGDERPVVTALDVGREVFANINGVAVFVVAPSSSTATSRHEIPDIAAAITVNDPSKSAALWQQMLGIGSLVAGAPTMDGRAQEIEGVSVASYRFEDDITVYFASHDHYVLVASTEDAMSQALHSLRGGKNVLDDPAFAPIVNRLSPHTTLAACAHPGRLAQLSQRYMSPREVAEMQPYLPLLADTVASVSVTHSDRMLRFTTIVTGIPDVGDFVSEMVARYHNPQAAVQAPSKPKVITELELK